MADEGRDLMDHLNQVKEHKEDGYWESLSASEKREWSSWMIHRFMSHSTDYLPVVNEVQSLLIGLDDRLVYEFWKNAIPRDPRWLGYIRADASEGGIPDWLLDIMREHFQISNEEAREYVDVYLSDGEGRDALRALVRKYGIDEGKRDELDKFISARGG